MPKETYSWIRQRSIHVFSLDERFNALLDVDRLVRKSQLRHQLVHQEFVRERLSHFHDPYDRCINLILSILHDRFVHFLALFIRFPHLEGVDAETDAGILKVLIEDERIVVLHFCRFGRL